MKTPNCFVLWLMQECSTRAWVYREGQGWLFAELTPDERAEFKSYQCGAITIPRMKVRIPSHAIWCSGKYLDGYKNWFVRCTMPQLYPLVQSKFQVRQIPDNEPVSLAWPVKPGDYETWLWADDIKMCREQGCEITIIGGYAWREWGVPPEWKAPVTKPIRVQGKEHIFIYALVDELTKVIYVGQTEHLEQRLATHLRDTENLEKVALIQSLRAQGREPELRTLEEVAGEKARERERSWTSHYKSQGYTIINKDFR